MNIAEAAQATGLTVDTIRYYERRGVLPPPARRPNQYRDYDDPHLAALTLAHGLRELELPLDQVAGIVRVAHDATCSDVREALMSSIDDAVVQIEWRIRKLRRTRERLHAIIGGIGSMSARSRRIPGLAPCPCVRIVDETR